MGRTRKTQTRTTAQRGYGTSHQRLRAQWAPRVARGGVACWRCAQPIQPTEPWDLGHDDHDRRITRGPEHRGRCNRAAAARKTNALRRAKSASMATVPKTTSRHNPSRQW